MHGRGNAAILAGALAILLHGPSGVHCLSLRGTTTAESAGVENDPSSEPRFSLAAEVADLDTPVGKKGAGLEGTYRMIYRAPSSSQTEAATEQSLSAQGMDLWGAPGSIEGMLQHTDQILDDNSAVAQPGIGQYYGNAAFFTKSPVSLEQAFAGVTSRTDADIEEGLNSVNGGSLDENLAAEEAAVGAAGPAADLVDSAGNPGLFAPSDTLGSTLNAVDPALGGALSEGSEFQRALRETMS